MVMPLQRFLTLMRTPAKNTCIWIADQVLVQQLTKFARIFHVGGTMAEPKLFESRA